MTQTAGSTIAQEDPAKSFASPIELESYQRAFAEDGSVVLRGVVPRERLARLHAAILDEFERARRAGGLFSGGGRLAGHLNCFPGADARFAFEALRSAGIIDVVRAISPKAARSPNVGCNLNLPNSVAQHYHMDRPFTRDFMIANVAVVDTDVANGAIDVVPGTHRRFYRYWQFALERAVRSPSKRLALRQGDVLVRTSSLWHRGMPNNTAVPRPMLAFTWEDGGSEHDDPFCIEQGKITFRPNWYRPDWIGRLRERAYRAAPITDSAYRIVRSLVSDKGYDR